MGVWADRIPEKSVGDMGIVVRMQGVGRTQQLGERGWVADVMCWLGLKARSSSASGETWNDELGRTRGQCQRLVGCRNQR